MRLNTFLTLSLLIGRGIWFLTNKISSLIYFRRLDPLLTTCSLPQLTIHTFLEDFSSPLYVDFYAYHQSVGKLIYLTFTCAIIASVIRLLC